MPSIKDYGVRMKLSVPQPEYIRFNPGSTAQNVGVTGTKVFSDGRELAPGQQVASMPPVVSPQNQQAPDLGNIMQPAQQPRITLPEAYRQQYGGPSTTPPNNLQMPDMTPRVGQGFTPSVNWSDFLTVAHNRYTR